MKRVQPPRRVSALLVLRQFLSMVFMLGGSGGLLLFLQWLLTEIDLLSLLSEAIADLIRGLQQLADHLIIDCVHDISPHQHPSHKKPYTEVQN